MHGVHGNATRGLCVGPRALSVPRPRHPGFSTQYPLGPAEKKKAMRKERRALNAAACLCNDRFQRCEFVACLPEHCLWRALSCRGFVFLVCCVWACTFFFATRLLGALGWLPALPALAAPADLPPRSDRCPSGREPASLGANPSGWSDGRLLFFFCGAARPSRRPREREPSPELASPGHATCEPACVVLNGWGCVRAAGALTASPWITCACAGLPTLFSRPSPGRW